MLLLLRAESIIHPHEGIFMSAFDGDSHDMFLMSVTFERDSQECPLNFGRFDHSCSNRLSELVIHLFVL